MDKENIITKKVENLAEILKKSNEARTNHPSPEKIRGYVMEELSENEMSLLDEHIEFCACCLEEVQEIEDEKLFRVCEEEVLVCQMEGIPTVEEFKALVAKKMAQTKEPIYKEPWLWKYLRARLAGFFTDIGFAQTVKIAACSVTILAILATIIWVASRSLNDKWAKLAEQPNRNKPLESPITSVPQQTPSPVPNPKNTPPDTPIKPQRNDTPKTRDKSVEQRKDNDNKRTKDVDFDLINAKNQLSNGDNQIAKQILDNPDRLDRLRIENGVTLPANIDGEPIRASDKQSYDKSPNGTYIKNNQPMLTWRSVPNVTHYLVSLRDSENNSIASREKVTKPEWTSPPLSPDKSYRWESIPVNSVGQELTKSVSKGAFNTLPTKTYLQIEEAEKKYKGSHLMLGITYFKAGLLDDAENEFRILVNENPQSLKAKRLLKKVLAVRKKSIN